MYSTFYVLFRFSALKNISGHTVYTLHTVNMNINYERGHTCHTSFYTTNRVPLLSWIHNITNQNLYISHKEKCFIIKTQDGSNNRTDLISVTFNKSQKTIIPFNIASVVEDKKPASLPPSSCSLHSAPTRFPIFQ